MSIVRPDKNLPCLQVSYDGRDVPYQAIPAFIACNACGKLIRQLITKCPVASDSIRLVVDDERKLMRDVMVASLGADGPTCIGNCRDNMELLRQIALPGVGDIERGTRAIAQQLRNVAELLHKPILPSDDLSSS